MNLLYGQKRLLSLEPRGLSPEEAINEALKELEESTYQSEQQLIERLSRLLKSCSPQLSKEESSALALRVYVLVDRASIKIYGGRFISTGSTQRKLALETLTRQKSTLFDLLQRQYR
jgi:hypothetical protein